MDSVCYDLGIRFGFKFVTELYQFGAQLFMIFDDAVVDDRDSILRYVRVCI